MGARAFQRRSTRDGRFGVRVGWWRCLTKTLASRLSADLWAPFVARALWPLLSRPNPRRITMPENIAELAQDKDDPTVYRVEHIDSDGGCEVAIFSGPNALERAIAFAGGDYYDGYADPTGLAGT